ncbi:MAG: hypothetical protein HY457_03100 [Parcubacteria group bacterium]|nr:hypothetical protein [Parcubacteria group bacterium]
MKEHFDAINNDFEKLPLARVIVEKPERCVACGETILSGEAALKETHSPKGSEEMSQKEKKAARTFSFYHSRCAPRKESPPSGEDIFDKGRRLPGSFEGGKRSR